MAEWNSLSNTDASNTTRFPENQNPSSVNDGARALEGMISRGLKATIDGCTTTGGTSTVYTLADPRTLSAYYDGLTICVQWHAATGASPTINVDALGAKNILWPDGTAVAANDLAINSRSILQYDGTQFQVLTSSVTPSSTSTLTNKTIDANGTGNAISNIETADLASAAKTGSDTAVVTGTAGTASDLAIWNGDGDLVDGPTPPSGTIVGTSDSQTLTNKTLTAPTLGGTTNLTGGQIAFPATQSPSAGANTLDDYEEGTWTPVLTFPTPGDLSVAYTTQFGSYTKIGDMVTVFFHVNVSTFTHTTASGTLQITGLPFTSANVANQLFRGQLSWNGITKATYTQISAAITSNVGTMTFIASGSGVGVSSVDQGDAPNGAAVILNGSITYKAA